MKGWYHEPTRHSLAARGVKTRKVFYFPDEPEVYGDYDEQDYELVEEDLERMGYYSPDDWYRGSGTSIVITNPKMLKDGRILRLFKRYGIRRGNEMHHGRGWHLESTRHSLAARGVKTKSTRMKRTKYPETNIDEIMDDELYFIRNDGWTCQLDDGKDIRLGLTLNIIDMRDADRTYDDDEYPYVVEAQIFVVPEQMSKIYRDKLDLTQEDNPSEVIYAAQSYGGGIPAINQLEGITSGREGIVDSKVRIDKSFGYTRTSRWFKTFDDAEKYIREVYAHNANALFGLIGFTLDAPVNRVGTTGWDLIEFQRKGTEWLKF